MRSLVAATFLLPALLLNAGGRVIQMYNAGTVEIEPLASILFVVASIALLGFCGVAIAKTESRAGRFVIGLAGVVFVIVNFILSLDVVSHARDQSADPRRHTIARAAELQANLRQARIDRAGMKMPETWATAESIGVAKGAVESAEVARQQECGKVGDNCRKRVAELSERQTELGNLMAAKAATDLILSADAKIADIEAEIASLGTIPSHADPGSARMARLTSMSEATMSEMLPLIFAACFELLALVGPRIAMIAMQPVRREEAAPMQVTTPAVRVDPPPLSGEVVAIPAPVEPPQRPIARPRPKLAVENKRPVGAILDFLSDGVEFVEGPRTDMAQAFMGYSAWCKATGHRAMDVPPFVEALESACKQFGIRIDGDSLVNVQLKEGAKSA